MKCLSTYLNVITYSLTLATILSVSTANGICQPASRGTDLPKIHFAVPDENSQRRFLQHHALLGADIEKMPEDTRNILLSSLAARYRIRAIDALQILVEGQRFSTERSAAFRLTVAAPGAKPEEEKRLSFERNRAETQLIAAALERLNAQVNIPARSRIQAVIYTQFDARPQITGKAGSGDGVKQ